MRRIVSFLFCFLLSFLGFSQLNSINKLNAEIEKLKKDPDLSHATWSLLVKDLKTGEVISDYNSDLSLVPASTLKIITTATALGILGPHYRYETKLEYSGTIDTITGILKGNLYINGSGDPTLGSELFKEKGDTFITEKWAKLIKAKGIKKINGDVIADASAFDDEMIPHTWIWADMGNYFGAGATGLNFMDNKYAVYFNSGDKPGDSTQIKKIIPAIPGLELTNSVTSDGRGDNAFIFGTPYNYSRYASGTIPLNKINYEVEGSMPDPALFCAQSLRLSLQKEGVNTIGAITTIRQLKIDNRFTNATRTLLFKHFSPSLDRIIYYTNLKSNNLFAETLLKTIAYEKTGLGSYYEAIESVKEFWTDRGIDVSGLFMYDGSGLSRANGATAKMLTDILTYMAKDTNFKSFYNSLPVAGRSGSIAGLCKGTCAEDNLRAKSGYITRARSYAGYVKNRKGNDLAFTIIMNNYTCSPTEIKKKMEGLMIKIAELEN